VSQYYVAKAFGRQTDRPPDPKSWRSIPDESMMSAKHVLYGAIRRRVLFLGIAAKRFAVRNSGAIAVDRRGRTTFVNT